MAKKPESESKTEPINIRLPSALLGRLETIGEDLGVKRAYLIQQAIVEFVEKRQRPDQQKPAHRKT